MQLLEWNRVIAVIRRHTGLRPMNYPASVSAVKLGLQLLPSDGGRLLSLRGRVLRYDASGHPDDAEILIARGCARHIRREFQYPDVQSIGERWLAEALYPTLSGCGLTGAEQSSRPLTAVEQRAHDALIERSRSLYAHLYQ